MDLKDHMHLTLAIFLIEKRLSASPSMLISFLVFQQISSITVLVQCRVVIYVKFPRVCSIELEQNDTLMVQC